MYDINYLIKLFKYVKDGEHSNDFEKNVKAIAESQKGSTKQYFEEIIDQYYFASDDYKRLRNMLQDWYTTHTTLSTIEGKANEIYSLPDKHLSELFRSFGYNISLNMVPLENKAKFFLDIVSFYKRKGTSETLKDVLNYYGFSDTTIIEYWLEIDPNNIDNLIFRPEFTSSLVYETEQSLQENIAYDTFVKDDPHWLYTEEDILQLHHERKINLPSKSPYFSISNTYSISNLFSVFAIMSRIVNEQYIDWINGALLSDHVPVKKMNTSKSLLVVFLASIYIYELLYGQLNGTSDTDYAYYEGNVNWSTSPKLPTNLDQIYKDFTDTLESRPASREEFKQKTDLLHSDWSNLIIQHILKNPGTAQQLLSNIDQNFKDQCDVYMLGIGGYDLISVLFTALSNWCRASISTDIAGFVPFILGFAFQDTTKDIINFFKPYHARLTKVSGIYVTDNPLTESINYDDTVKLAGSFLFIDIPNHIYNYDHNEFHDRGIAYDTYLITTSLIFTDMLSMSSSYSNLDDGSFFDDQYIRDGDLQVKITQYVHESYLEYSDTNNQLCKFTFSEYNLRAIYDILNITITSEFYDVQYTHDELSRIYITENLTDTYQTLDELFVEQKLMFDDHPKNKISEYDIGDFFDIGVAEDNLFVKMKYTEQDILNTNHQYYNQVVEQTLNPDNSIRSYEIDGRDVEFDGGALFDEPYMSDTLQIFVYE